MKLGTSPLLNALKDLVFEKILKEGHQKAAVERIDKKHSGEKL